MSVELLNEVIAASGLSNSQFAARIMGRDERTIRRWVNGDIVIPELAATWLASVESIQVSPESITITLRR